MSGTPPATGYGAAGGPFGPAASTSDALFRQIYEHAKLNDNWPKVASALKAHPDWLLKIPEGECTKKINEQTFHFLSQVVDGQFCIKLCFRATQNI